MLALNPSSNAFGATFSRKGRKGRKRTQTLLPLREKVAAKLTDERFR